LVGVWIKIVWVIRQANADSDFSYRHSMPATKQPDHSICGADYSMANSKGHDAAHLPIDSAKRHIPRRTTLSGKLPTGTLTNANGSLSGAHFANRCSFAKTDRRPPSHSAKGNLRALDQHSTCDV
jgi:hypothetical protein